MGSKMVLDGVEATVSAGVAAGLVQRLETPPWMVPKLRAVERIIAAGLANAMVAALAADPVAKLRFDAAVELRSDDAQIRAFLAAIGANADQVLAR